MDYIIFVVVAAALFFYFSFYRKEKLKEKIMTDLKFAKHPVPEYFLPDDLLGDVSDYGEIFLIACSEYISIQAYIAATEHLEELSDDYKKVKNNSKYSDFDIKKWNRTISPLIDNYTGDLYLSIHEFFDTIKSVDKAASDKLSAHLEHMTNTRDEIFSRKVLDFVSKFIE